ALHPDLPRSTLFPYTTLFRSSAGQSPEPLTGNWVVRTQNNDGTFRTTYLNLKQEGPRITGTIRVTQFFYHISESTGGPDGFTNRSEEHTSELQSQSNIVCRLL